MAEISIIEILIIISEGVWVIFPAYIANSSAVLFGHGKPVDMGRKLSDGYRIFGDGKTWYGLLGGVLAGIAFGFGQILGSGIQYPKHHWGYGPVPNAYLIAILIPLGALLGDLLGSLTIELTFFLGLIALIKPLTINLWQVFNAMFWLAAAITFIMIILKKKAFTWKHGIVLLGIFAGFLTLEIVKTFITV